MQAINTPTYLRLREQIRTDIVAGIWKLGSHITLAELSKHYGVSANPVREALLQLQGEGVIDMRMNRGAVIPASSYRSLRIRQMNRACTSPAWPFSTSGTAAIAAVTPSASAASPSRALASSFQLSDTRGNIRRASAARPSHNR